MLSSFIALDPVRIDPDLKYLPLPNRSELVLSDDVPPIEFVPTAFMVCVTDEGNVVAAINRRRGCEVPGGHVEPGETAIDAAVREAYEEAGCVLEDIRPLAFQRLITDGVKPDGYVYPYPISFQMFFVGRVVRMDPVPHNDEVGDPVILTPQELGRLSPISAAICAYGLKAHRSRMILSA